MDRKKNRMTMMGMKLSTLPTPAKMPSVTRLCSMGDAPEFAIAAATQSPTAVIP